MSVPLRFGASSNIGLVRKKQDDSSLQQSPLFVVADGMGGHAGGDVASRIAIETLAQKVSEEEGALSAAVRDANRSIYEEAGKDPSLKGMGTTVTAMYANEDSVQIVHVGDSRAYLLRDGLSQLTRDHTYVGRLVSQGRISPEDADHHPQRSYLERALGIGADVEVDVDVFDVMPGDRILLCSDGLHSMIDDLAIEQILSSIDDPQEASDRLCEEAVNAGGHDNVTTIVVDYPGPRRVTGAKPGVPPVRAVKRRWGTRLIALALVVLLLTVGGLAARAALRSSWYVADHGGRVSIFNGTPGSFAGIELSELELTTPIATTSLPDLYQRRLEEGMKVPSRAEALATVTRLRELSGSEEPIGTAPPTPTQTVVAP